MSGNINFNGWINDDGSENYKCRAWVNFNGTGTVAIRASGNVSSITDNGTGDYTVNFTTAMPDTNYSVSGTATRDITNNYNYGHTWAPGNGVGYNTTSVRMFYNYYTAPTLYDALICSVTIFR